MIKISLRDRFHQPGPLWAFAVGILVGEKRLLSDAVPNAPDCRNRSPAGPVRGELLGGSGFVLRTSSATALRRPRFEHGNLGLLWQESPRHYGAVGQTPKKERLFGHDPVVRPSASRSRTVNSTRRLNVSHPVLTCSSPPFFRGTPLDGGGNILNMNRESDTSVLMER